MYPTPSFPLRSAFVAIPLEGMAKWQFQALHHELESHRDILSLQKVDSPHLTLQFFPEVFDIEYQPILEQMKRIAAAASSFELRIQGIDTFSHRGQDKVLFLTPVFSPELAALKKSCPWVSDKPFHPHITLARIRHPEKFAVRKKQILKVIGSPDFSMNVDRIRLYGMVHGERQVIVHEEQF